MTDSEGAATPRGFNARAHFESGLVCKCFRCERLGEHSWPAGWVLSEDGFECPECALKWWLSRVP